MSTQHKFFVFMFQPAIARRCKAHYISMGAEVHILLPISNIKDADLRYHNTRFRKSFLHGKTLGVQIIVAPTVHVLSPRKHVVSDEETCKLKDKNKLSPFWEGTA